MNNVSTVIVTSMAELTRYLKTYNVIKCEACSGITGEPCVKVSFTYEEDED